MFGYLGPSGGAGALDMAHVINVEFAKMALSKTPPFQTGSLLFFLQSLKGKLTGIDGKDLMRTAAHAKGVLYLYHMGT